VTRAQELLARCRRLPSGCLWWTGAKTQDGYATAHADGRTVVAHRYVYEQTVGPIPPGLQLDHVCRTRACLNVLHLEPVTPCENTRRIVRTPKTHCIHGHPYDEANTYVDTRGHRTCRTCKRRQHRDYLRARRAAGLDPRQQARVTTHTKET
jgi:hypothetical protein